MKTTILALLLLIASSDVAASSINFPDKNPPDSGFANVELVKPKPNPPKVDEADLPYGLLVAAAHNNVPDQVIENLDKHPLGNQEIASVQGVPLPAAAWLFMSGLAGLIRIMHRRKKCWPDND